MGNAPLLDVLQKRKGQAAALRVVRHAEVRDPGLHLIMKDMSAFLLLGYIGGWIVYETHTCLRFWVGKGIGVIGGDGACGK